MVLDVNALLQPIAGDEPAGPNLRHASGGAYYRVKDARSTARIAERQADAEAERGSLVPEWRVILDLSQEVLGTQSKDLEVACWMTEAALRIHGYAGLRDCFALLDGLVERFWEHLHSIDAEDISAKVAPLTGLNGSGADGALIQPLRLAPLTSAVTGEPGGLWHYMVLRRRGAASPEAVLLAEAARSTTADTFRAIYRDIAASLASYTALTTRLDGLCGDDSPPASTIRNTLVEAQDALRDFSGVDFSQIDAQPVSPAAAPDPVPDEIPDRAAAPRVAGGPAPLHTREDALRELARIATFFREHEPNSPTAYTLNTLIRRARLPLTDLLAELIPDEAVRRTYLTVAGIGAEPLEK